MESEAKIENNKEIQAASIRLAKSLMDAASIKFGVFDAKHYKAACSVINEMVAVGLITEKVAVVKKAQIVSQFTGVDLLNGVRLDDVINLPSAELLLGPKGSVAALPKNPAPEKTSTYIAVPMVDSTGHYSAIRAARTLSSVSSNGPVSPKWVSTAARQLAIFGKDGWGMYVSLESTDVKGETIKHWKYNKKAVLELARHRFGKTFKEEDFVWDDKLLTAVDYRMF